MRFDRLKIHGFGPFKDVDLDLSGIDGTLVAVAGPNGAGKTTLLELLTGGACYRKCKTRGTLAHLATERAAFVEATVVNGRTWTIRQTMDAMNGKGESLVLDADGEPVLDDTKVSAYDDWAKLNIVPPQVLYSSSVGLQLSSPVLKQEERGFLALGRADRMAVLLRIIGMERLEKLAELARKHVATDIANLGIKRVSLCELEKRAVTVSDASEALEASERVRDAEVRTAEAARDALRRAELASENAAAAEEIRTRRAAAATRVSQAKAAIGDNELRQRNNKAILGEAEAIRDAVATDAALVTEANAHAETQQTCKDEAADLKARAINAEATLRLARNKKADAERDISRATRRLEGRDAVDAAVASIPGLETAREAAEEAVSKSVDALKGLRESRLTHKDDRIKLLRGGVEDMVETPGRFDEEARDAAADVLATDNDLVERFVALPGTISVGEHQLIHEQDAARLAQGEERKARETAARAGGFEAAAADLERATALLDEGTAAEAELVPEASRQREEANRKAERVETLAEMLRSVRDQRLEIEPLCKKAAPLAQAEARVEELEAAHAGLAEQLAGAETELAGLPDTPEGKAPDVDGLREALGLAERRAQARAAEVGQQQAKLEAAHASAKRSAEMKVEIDDAETRLNTWTKLSIDLGRDGLQALEVDAAVPTLNALVNDLLHTCHGSRFTVDFRTDKLTADGKSMREALDVRVIDSEKGRDDLAETYSGGELVIVGEAVALGLSVLGAECMGIDKPTLVRDETGAALDADNRPAYVRMLRHAAKTIGADKVLFVSHNDDVVALADARILIDKSGHVEVVT